MLSLEGAEQLPSGSILPDGELCSTDEQNHIGDDLQALAVEVNAAHKEVETHLNSAVEKAIQIGQKLILAKALVKADQGPGHWESWVKAHLTFTPRHARRYILLARNKEQIGLTSPKSARQALSILADNDTTAAAHAAPESGEEKPRERCPRQAVNRDNAADAIVAIFLDHLPEQAIQEIAPRWTERVDDLSVAVKLREAIAERAAALRGDRPAPPRGLVIPAQPE